jgi:hypothetical protein
MANFVKLQSRSYTFRQLINDIVKLLKTKRFDCLSFDPLLITIAWCCSQAHTKFLLNESFESFRVIKRRRIRLIHEDQRVFLGLKVIPDVVLNFIITLSKAPQIFKVSFVSLHEMFIGVY